MISQTIKIGQRDFTVSGNSLQEVLQAAAPLETISRRVGNGTLVHRQQDDYDFYEAVRYVKIDGERRKAVKQLGTSKEDKELFLAAGEPYRVYVKDADYELVQFDYLTPALEEAGFTADATRGFVKARRTTSAKGRSYTPVA